MQRGHFHAVVTPRASDLKGPEAMKHMGPIDNRIQIFQKKRLTAIFRSIYGLVCQKSMFERRENIAVLSAAILCLAVCVCDVMNKVGMCCGRSVGYIMIQPFSALKW